MFSEVSVEEAPKSKSKSVWKRKSNSSKLTEAKMYTLPFLPKRLYHLCKRLYPKKTHFLV